MCLVSTPLLSGQPSRQHVSGMALGCCTFIAAYVSCTHAHPLTPVHSCPQANSRAPTPQAPLSALYQAIDARVSAYHQLLRLHGRLSLVTAHTRAAARVADANKGGAAVTGVDQLEPETVFQDGSEEDDVEVCWSHISLSMSCSR